MPVGLSVRRTKAVRDVAPDTRRLKREIERILAELGRPDDELSVLIGDDALLRGLNLQWRGVDAPTDVLSFPLEDLPAGAPPDEPVVLGDLVISVETAARQAEEIGHDLMTELLVLAVHGTLHLFGHDHEGDASEAARMSAEEERVLGALGVDARAALIARAR